VSPMFIADQPAILEWQQPTMDGRLLQVGRLAIPN
jgi:hypothetical protein